MIRRHLFVLFLVSAILVMGCTSAEKTTKDLPVTPIENTTPETTSPAVCIDSDEDSIFVKGNVTFGSEHYEDSCADNLTVNEQRCVNNVPSVSMYDCFADRICIDGVCAVKIIPKPIPEKTCTDSDGGINENLSGSVYDGITTYKDYCMTGYNNKVKEFACIEKNKIELTIECPKGYRCLNARCEVWLDSCDDKSYAKKVIIDDHSGFIKTYSDYCTGNSTMLHYYCDGANAKTTVITCNETQWCSNTTATCQPKTCKGQSAPDKYSANYVTDGLDFYVDFCLSHNVVTDYFCSDGDVQSINMECPENHTCKTHDKPIQITIGGVNDKFDYPIGACELK